MKLFSKTMAVLFVLCALLIPSAAFAKVDCPFDPCHPYDPCDPCYMASACTTCYGCSLCCGHENIPYKEFDCSKCTYPCEDKPVTPIPDPIPTTEPEFTPTVKIPEMPKTGNPAFVLASAILVTLGVAVMPKSR
ncbi:MAG: hypothetical protein IJB92_02315 [Clostridia bacterium]|nr:hypothetical protein [Clostridia bacterium]